LGEEEGTDITLAKALDEQEKPSCGDGASTETGSAKGLYPRWRVSQDDIPFLTSGYCLTQGYQEETTSIEATTEHSVSVCPFSSTSQQHGQVICKPLGWYESMYRSVKERFPFEEVKEKYPNYKFGGTNKIAKPLEKKIPFKSNKKGWKPSQTNLKARKPLSELFLNQQQKAEKWKQRKDPTIEMVPHVKKKRHSLLGEIGWSIFWRPKNLPKFTPIKLGNQGKGDNCNSSYREEI